MPLSKSKLTLYILLFILVISVFRIAQLISDYLWFKALGYQRVFMISLEAQILLFFVAGLLFFLFLTLNLWLSSKLRTKNLVSFKMKMAIALFLSYIVGSTVSLNWLEILRYFRQVPFNLTDPIFFKDVAFYVFSLPFLSSLWKFVFMSLMITTLLVILDYLQGLLASIFKAPKIEGENIKTIPQYNVNIMGELKKLKRFARVHISLLVSAIFILFAAKHYLAQFLIMYSKKGIVVGAGYTDVVVFLPIIKILMVLAVVVAVVVFIWIAYNKNIPRKRFIIAYIVIGYFVLAFVGQSIVPALVQSLRVSPNEINLEKPYIENNIKFTREAYGLSDVSEKDFYSTELLTSQMIADAPETIDNIRILDWRPLTTTYKQTQEIRLYYDLFGVDIDRYDLGGKYTQVMLAPRELEQSQITEDAKTWVNLHMVYTHGYGLVMSPVNTVTKQGLPNYLIQDIPPRYTIQDEDIVIDRPEIYYGERDNDFVLVNTKTEEFNYPKGNENEYITYDGKGGIVLDSFAKKLLMAFRFRDIKILLSSDMTSESKIMFHRNIKDRISRITPFLVLDEDPYVVINDGRLFWIQDAYTVTGNYPYSEKFGSINYMRNSVKVVLDAYNGDVTYYIVDKSDPMVMTYNNVYPGLFKNLADMPAGLQQHLRYPEDLFKVQSQVYSTYHMDDATVFYNKEDAWQLPNEIYGTGQQVQVEPYYNILKLPGETSEEFVLMISFTPIKKDNMVAWFAARSDGENYGKLFLYKFPKDKLIYGPSQIEARIDQDSEISQQLTLWSQQGSRVTRGNLLVIPIDNALLYVEPLYIQSEKGQLPELKRVLVSDGESVAMEETLGEALEVLFGKVTTETKEDRTQEELVSDANTFYGLVLDSMQSQDWAGIGTNLDKLGDILQQMSQPR